MTEQAYLSCGEAHPTCDIYHGERGHPMHSDDPDDLALALFTMALTQTEDHRTTVEDR